MVVDEFVAGHGLGFLAWDLDYLRRTSVVMHVWKHMGEGRGVKGREGFPTENSSEHRRTSSRRQLRQIFLKRLPQTMRALQLPVL